MRGLFSSGADETLAFCRLVQQEAISRGKVFFIADAEGHDEMIGDVLAENMSGWLVPKEDADRFERVWLNDINEVWESESDYFVWEKWSRGPSGDIKIDFVRV